MKKRLKLTGWFIVGVLSVIIITALGVVLIPVWGILWIITGKFYPSKAITWLEDNLPYEVTS